MKNKLSILSAAVLITLVANNKNVKAHCEIPCGIYGDSLRVSMIYEHIETIEKSMKMINELTSKEEKNHNQIVRWVTNKETHASEIQKIVSEYFLHQRIKITDPGDSAKYKKYQKSLELLHKLLVYSMKSKQTVDLVYVEKLKNTLREFEGVYFHKH